MQGRVVFAGLAGVLVSFLFSCSPTNQETTQPSASTYPDSARTDKPDVSPSPSPSELSC